MRDAALELISRGVVPIPITYRRKTPVKSEWQHVRLETVDMAAFDKKVNLGALLGEPSGWTVDVDLDCPETIALAPYLLLSTRIFGRETARASHYLYRAAGAETTKFYDPVMVARKEKKKAMLVELRSTGCQTVLPPSVHELGEAIEYDTSSEDHPVIIKASTLIEEIEELASAALFVRYAGLEVEQAVTAARERRLPDDLPELVIEAVRKWLHITPPTKALAPRPRAMDVVDRARAYVARIPGAVSGNGGHDTTYDVALALVCGFELGESDAMSILEDYNRTCDPPWSERELQHKLADAAKSNKVGRGYLRDAERPKPTLTSGHVNGTNGANGSNGTVARLDDVRRPWRSRSYLTAVSIIEENARDVLEGRRLELNDMTGRIELERKLIRDADVHRIRGLIEARFAGGRDKDGNEIGLQLATSDIFAAVEQVAAARAYHPVKEYLCSLTWDGVPRLDHVAHDILAAEDTPLNRLLVTKFFLSAVARPLDPGCKVDTVLILVGPQGALKSTFFRSIGSPWFDDTAIDLSKKDAFESLRNAWILEWAELESLLRARDTNSVKAFLSSSKDTYRPSYGRNVVEVKRSGIIVGSTNHEEFLSDETGSRRFHPLIVGLINISIALEQRDQLWAEAVHRYRKGEAWWLTDAESVDLERIHQQHRVSDAWEDSVLGWASLRTAPFSTGDVLREALEKPEGQWGRADEMRVCRILKGAGWSRKTDPGKRNAKTWHQP